MALTLPGAAAGVAASNSVARTLATATLPETSVTPMTWPAHMGRLTLSVSPSRPSTSEMSLAMPASRSAAARGRASLPCEVAVPITSRAPVSRAMLAMAGASASAVPDSSPSPVAWMTSP